MQKRRLQITFSALALTAVASFNTGVLANGSWKPQVIIDMTAGASVSADVVVTTDFIGEIGLTSLSKPILSVASDGINFDTQAPPKSGWTSLVEVDLTEEPALAFGQASNFSHTLASIDEQTTLQGFYSMRYQFNADSRFRPYAGAGLGVVAKATETEAAGIIAGRASAGFDLTLGKGSAFFAEYQLLKNGGVTLGGASAGESAVGAAPDVEHSVKLGFRRSF